MKTEEQRIAIAEACGWKDVAPRRWSGYTDTYDPLCTPADSIGSPAKYWGYVPDYLNDLNAMHEAEKVLDDRNRQCVRYAEELERVLARAHEKCLDPSRFGMIHATADQRAEAFLRTIGRWQDDAEDGGEYRRNQQEATP
jgi:hypothetical protein